MPNKLSPKTPSLRPNRWTRLPAANDESAKAAAGAIVTIPTARGDMPNPVVRNVAVRKIIAGMEPK